MPWRLGITPVVRSLAPAALLGITTGLSGQSSTWDGGGASNNWNDAINWVGNTAPPPAGNIDYTLTFVGGANVPINSVQNFAPFRTNIITLSGNIPAGFNISGNVIVMTRDDGISNNQPDININTGVDVTISNQIDIVRPTTGGSCQSADKG